MEMRASLKTNLRARIVVLTLMAFTLSGCVSQKYPSSWSEPMENLPDDCSAIAGDYVGTCRSDRLGLLDILAGHPAPRKCVQHVQLSIPKPGTLKVVAYGSNGSVVHELTFSESDKTLSCNARGAEITRSGFWGEQEVAGVTRVKIELGRDKSGNLIVRNDEAGVAFYGPIPLPGGEADWYRFGEYGSGTLSSVPDHDEASQDQTGDYEVSHILVDSKAKAEAILAKLKQGYSFKKLARSESKDAGSRDEGGDLGWGFLHQYPKAFADAILKLRKGQISQPVHTQYGWHIIRLNDIRAHDAATPSKGAETINRVQ
jgi:hypothetical protein